jgi:hypothetical protein
MAAKVPGNGYFVPPLRIPTDQFDGPPAVAPGKHYVPPVQISKVSASWTDVQTIESEGIANGIFYDLGDVAPDADVNLIGWSEPKASDREVDSDRFLLRLDDPSDAELQAVMDALSENGMDVQQTGSRAHFHQLLVTESHEVGPPDAQHSDTVDDADLWVG